MLASRSDNTFVDCVCQPREGISPYRRAEYVRILFARIVGLVAPKGIDKDAKAALLAAADALANSAETQDFITKNLLMRPVQWGEAHADETAKVLYDTFGEQANM